MRKLATLLVGLGFAAVGCSTESASPGSAQGGTPSAGTSHGSGAGSSSSGAAAVGGAPGAGASGGGGSAALPNEAGAASAGESGTSAAAGASGEGGTAARLPAELLDLASWKLTLPTGEAESPAEIVQPALATFELAPYFHVDAQAQAVLFRAHAGGVTTSGSGYPRSELREMTSDGSDEAAWSMTSGTHTLTIRQAITHLPVVKPHVVAGQIHDAEDDVVMIRLEGEQLFVEGGGEELGDLNPSYQLGTEFTVRIVASAGVIAIYYDDLVTPKVEVPSEASNCYFKAGAYTQSNPERGDEPTAYGEVAIYDLELTHQ